MKHFEDSKLQDSEVESEQEFHQPLDFCHQISDDTENEMAEASVPRVDIVGSGSGGSDVQRDDDSSTKREEERKESNVEQIYTRESTKTERSKTIEENVRRNFEIEANVIFPNKSAHISMWDFAGEDVFYATHHVFLSPDAVYLIVIDLSNSETNNVIEIGRFLIVILFIAMYQQFFRLLMIFKNFISMILEKARFWLRSILTYAKVKDTNMGCGFRLPPVIFVVTHKDKLPGEVSGFLL